MTSKNTLRQRESRARAKAGVRKDPKRDPTRRRRELAEAPGAVGVWVGKFQKNHPNGPTNRDEAQMLAMIVDTASRLADLVPAHAVAADKAKRAARLKAALDAAPGRFKSKCPAASDDAVAAVRDCMDEVARAVL